jgi:hypothetical protein
LHPAFQIDRDREVGCADDPSQIINRQRKRDTLSIRETVRMGDRPTARCDRLSTRRRHGSGATCIPNVEKDERLSGDM